MLAVIFTIVMFAALVVGLVKGVHPACWMFLLAISAGLLWVVITQRPLTKESVSGNMFVDIFEMIQTAAVSQFPTVILVLGVVLGYIAYLDLMKAPAMFAYIVAKPLQKFNKPYLICVLGFFVAALMKFVIPAPASVVALLLSTVYPVMRSLGISKPAIASVLVLGCSIPWGPANSFTFVAFNAAGLDATMVPQWAVTDQMLSLIPVFVIMAITIFVSAKCFDRRDGHSFSDTEALVASGLEGVSRGLAVLPLLPLIIVLFFNFVVKITMGIVTAIFISLAVAIIVKAIVTRRQSTGFRGALAEVQTFFTEAGGFLGSTGFLLIASNMFATVIQGVGGLQYLLDAATASNMNPYLLLFIAMVILVVMVAMTGATIGMIPLFAPLFVMIANVTGADPYGLIGLMMVGLATCGTIGLVYLSNLVVANEVGVKITTMSKRNALPALLGTAACFVYTCIVFM